ncbi:hypothetical protein BFW94_12565 [Enterobacter ludwigii]|uniref:hypothetical protein n=1 Tax=Enterobacter ludwigii TaxID=299767 RepID=UPI000999A148|nr:hypothetical protein [Enterobacter ludwigii]OPB23647.1 hypothetical protein BFW94_12565 [Enterobacter ludwigii]
MSNIDKQWLQQKIADMEEHRDLFPGDLDDDHGSVLAAFRIALASLEAEAVCVIDQSNLDYLKLGSDADVWPASRTEMGDVLLYRTAPPASVPVPDEMKPKQASRAYCGEVRGYRDGWNACRAAMLQGAEPVTTDYKLPFEQWLSQQTGTIDVECGCVMTEVFFHWLRVAYDADNSPVIPDGWVLVPKEPTPDMLNAAWVSHGIYHASAYHTMLAAAPQQVK